MVLYILLIATANLCLGFGLAAYLGRRNRAAVGASWGAAAALGQSIDEVLAGEPNLAAGVAILTRGPPEGQSAEPTADAAPGPASGATTGPPAGRTDPAGSSPTPRPEMTPGEKAVEDLGNEVQRYHQQVTRADEKLRACAEDPNAAEVEAILGSLKDSTEQYLSNRNQAHGTFKSVQQGQPATGGICDDLQAAIEGEDRQIQDTCAMIEGFDYEDRLEEGCRRMSEKTVKLIDCSERLRETLGEVKLELGRNEPPPREAARTTQDGPASESSGQAALEAEPPKWWNAGPDETPRLSVAVIELDHAPELKQQYGREVADKILGAIGQLSKTESDGEGGFFPLAEQRLLLVFPEADTDSAANRADRLRQTIEKARLHHGQSELRVTVSCAVAGATAAESPDALVQRAKATLREAQRYGGNRTFLHDGRFPTPVVPPNFSLAEEQITL